MLYVCALNLDILIGKLILPTFCHNKYYALGPQLYYYNFIICGGENGYIKGVGKPGMDWAGTGNEQPQYTLARQELVVKPVTI